jgi:hypothetical protein
MFTLSYRRCSRGWSVTRWNPALLDLRSLYGIACMARNLARHAGECGAVRLQSSWNPIDTRTD